MFETSGTVLVDPKNVFRGPLSLGELASTEPSRLRRAVAATDSFPNSLSLLFDFSPLSAGLLICSVVFMLSIISCPGCKVKIMFVETCSRL